MTAPADGTTVGIFVNPAGVSVAVRNAQPPFHEPFSIAVTRDPATDDDVAVSNALSSAVTVLDDMAISNISRTVVATSADFVLAVRSFAPSWDVVAPTAAALQCYLDSPQSANDSSVVVIELGDATCSAELYVGWGDSRLESFESVLKMTRDWDRLSVYHLEAVAQLVSDLLGSREALSRESSWPTIVLTGGPAKQPLLRAHLAGLGAVADLGDPETVIARGAAAFPHSAIPPRQGGGEQESWDDDYGDTGASESPTYSDGYYAGPSDEFLIDADASADGVHSPPDLSGDAAGYEPIPGFDPSDDEALEVTLDDAFVDAADDERPTPTSEARFLTAYITRDGQIFTRALVPERTHRLEVLIAVPNPDDHDAVVANAPFDEQGVPSAAGPLARLTVDVWSDDGSVHASAPIDISMTDRTRSSTAAVIDFTTGHDGVPIQLNITVLYLGRPIQAAILSAPVRAEPAVRDEVQLFIVPLSAGPEPSEGTTPADATLELSGDSLMRLGMLGPMPDPVTGVLALASVFEETASRILGIDVAPNDFGDEDARALLVALARSGSLLQRKLADLGLDDARTIAVKVRYDAPIIPLELAYDGTAPMPDAKVCDCYAEDMKPLEATVSHASARVVCPYAFWGLSRVIARTIMGRPVTKVSVQRPKPGPLSLRPVLYGAATKADQLAAPGAKPSAMLEAALSRGLEGRGFTRVKSWTAWLDAVENKKPELLVVLGHTELGEVEPTLVIGDKSRLSQATISVRHLCAANQPAPVVLLFACSSGLAGSVFSSLPGTFVDNGAAAVVASLTRFRGAHAAAAAAAVFGAMHDSGPSGLTLGAALTNARRQLVSEGLLVGLLLVAHGEIDIELRPTMELVV